MDLSRMLGQPQYLSASTDQGSVSIDLLPNRALMNISYVQTGMKAINNRSSAESIVKALCEREIENMRNTLTDLGNQLLKQVDDDGSEENVTVSFDHSDRRQWSDEDARVRIQGSIFKMSTDFHRSLNSKPAGFIRGAINAQIRSREDSIRKMYSVILADIKQYRERIGRVRVEDKAVVVVNLD